MKHVTWWWLSTAVSAVLIVVLINLWIQMNEFVIEPTQLVSEQETNEYLQKNWSWLGPKLKGKLHIYIGDMDTFYLNNAVVLLEEFLESTKNPYYDGTVEYADRKPHCWGPRGAELLKMFEIHILLQ